MKIRLLLIGLFLGQSIVLLAQDEIIDETTYRKSTIYLDQGWEHITGRDYIGAVEKFDNSIALYDGNADAYVGRANALSMLDRLDEAENDIKQALQMTGDQSDMLYLAGNVFFKMKKYQEAREYYSAALRHNEQSEVKIDSANVYYNRGNAYFEDGLYRSAINDFSRTILMHEGFKNAYHNRGLSYVHRDMLEEACADFDTAIALGSTISAKFRDKYCQ